ncbi:MAG: carboxypeptidase-like regulatory domain-containing protein [Bacteroidetes bacterium]|nr:MAG: carboxypeptidase-like regulatory domain-containing protein [Bacteroidota bacterium]
MNPTLQRISSLLILSFYFACTYSQDKDLIQFSGVIVESDSLRPVPFTRVIIKGSGRGTLADYSGYFSFVAQKKDTIIFSAMGYRRAQYIIPDTLSGNKYSLIQTLNMDTIMLATAVIYQWLTPEEFKKVFLIANVYVTDLDRAKKNLEREEMKEKFETMPMDGNMNYKSSMQQYQSKLYWAGQYPQNNLLNPFAWAQFVKMWREGKLKIKGGNEKKE